MLTNENLSDRAAKLDGFKNKIQCYPDFPKPGILFRDIFPALRDAATLRDVVDLLVAAIKEKGWDKVDIVVGLDARGFILGPLVALALNVGFAPVRKKGKLPGQVHEIAYTLEYRTDTVEVQADSIAKGQKVLVIDDLLATGGTLMATCSLMEKLGADVIGCIVALELKDLQGYKHIPSPVISLLQF